MREMKDSKIKWINDIPSNWNVNRVKDWFFQKKSKALQKDPVVLSLARSWVKVRDISSNEWQLAESYYEYNPVEPDDLLLNPMDLVSWDNCSLSKVSWVISPAYTNLRYKKGFNPNYYIYYFKYQYRSMAFFSYWKWVSFENRRTLNTETIMKYPLLVPSFHEQTMIANYLDKKCAEIDFLYADIEKQIEILVEYKNSVITEVVTKWLNPNVDMKNSWIERVLHCPKHWNIMPNKYVMHKKKEICPRYNNEDILSLTMDWVVIRDLEAWWKMPTSFDGYQIIYPNNLLMCLFDYDVTPRCIWLIKNKWLTSPAYSQFVLDNGNNPRYYYYYYLMLDNTKELLHLAKNLRHSFTEDQLWTIKTPVPPIKEQEEIANFLDKKCLEINEAINWKKNQLETLEEYKRSLIYEYVTGKKEVPEKY